VFASDDGKRALAADAATAPVSKAIDAIEKEVVNQKSLLTTSDAAMTALSRDFTAARLRFNAVRYDSEARLNQVVANIYELQVRKSNVSAERHHQRSQRFFFGMLAAQMGVIIATFAMAAKQRNLLWSLATGAGVVAIAFAIYVYLYV
jgi:phosphotransferase system  glucose/maltose/N-acetylglucosamine-specific IIC component